MPGRALFFHGGAHAGEFGGGGFGNEGRVVRENGFLRQGRAVGPNCVGDVARYVQADVFGGEGGFKLAFGGQRQHVGRRARRRAVRQFGGQPVGVGRDFADFLQFYAAALELVCGLFPIAAIRPQAGFVGGNDQGADRTGEAGKIYPRLPVFGQVFGQMRIGGRDNPGGEVVFAHGLAEFGKALGGGVHELFLSACAPFRRRIGWVEGPSESRVSVFQTACPIRFVCLNISQAVLSS